MKSRDHIRSQQSLNSYIFLAWVVSFGGFLILGAAFEIWAAAWAIIVVMSIGFGVAVYRTTPRCPFCRTVYQMYSRRISNYCSECGNSFDKPVPITK
ncbi:MAG: hypothetical protein AB8B55_11870 [Mariniblastus sp.]